MGDSPMSSVRRVGVICLRCFLMCLRCFLMCLIGSHPGGNFYPSPIYPQP